MGGTHASMLPALALSSSACLACRLSSASIPPTSVWTCSSSARRVPPTRAREKLSSSEPLTFALISLLMLSIIAPPLDSGRARRW